MSKLKEYFSKHKKSCILAIVVIGCATYYCITGQDVSADGIVEKICLIINCG